MEMPPPHLQPSARCWQGLGPSAPTGTQAGGWSCRAGPEHVQSRAVTLQWSQVRDLGGTDR